MKRTLVVVQARTGSSRLPGKILMPLAGAPLLVRMMERVLAAKTPVEAVVATTTDPSDDAVLSLCEANDFPIFRGHPTDLLDRHHRAALAAKADVVVKIPSDCPLVDPAIIDRVLGAFAADDRCDYASNLHPATYPDGNDVEVMAASALATAWREADRPHEREHTTPFLWDQPGRFRMVNVTWETGFDWSMSHRFTVDYREDYEFAAAVYDELWTPSRPVFSLDDIVSLLAARSDLAAINEKYAGVNWYRHHLGELRTIAASQTRSPEPTP